MQLEDDLCLLSGTRLASLIRSGRVTAREVLERHIEQIERVNPVINALVHDRFEHARREADEADARVRQTAPEDLPLLFGVPCSIKEAFSLSGMPNTSGLMARRGITAERDATVVKRLREGGAIPVGVTNVSELCMWMESSNRVYGRTNNPYDPRRMVGGSSGGEGALIATGAVPFGLGSDIGGSIRMPAFFNGVFGHKPTGGLVPSTGQFPISHGDALHMLTSGPLARRAEDLWPLLELMAGPDGQDQACRDFLLGDPSSVDLRNIVVLDVPNDGKRPVASSLERAQQRASSWLSAAGAAVHKTKLPRMARAVEIWSARLNRSGGDSFACLLGSGKEDRSVGLLARWLLRRSPHTLPAILLAYLEGIQSLTPERSRKALREGEILKEEVLGELGSDGVMLYPSFARPAPLHYVPMLRPFEFRYTAIFNVLELPVTQVPLGLDERGVPLGVQVVAAPGNDHLTIAVAMELERAFGGWRPPARWFGDST